MSAGMRLFVGVPVSAAVAGELAGTCESLARRATSRGVTLRWVAPAAYHVTLRYLGWARAEVVPAIEAAVQRAVVGVSPFRFRTARLGAFRSEARATVVWAGVDDGAAALIELAAALEREVVPLGFAPERRAFHPHVTLARLREPTNVEEVLLPFAEQVFSETRCDSVTLFESITKPTGSEYRAVARAPLGGPISPVHRQSDPVKPAPLDAASGSDDGWDKHPGG